MSTTFYFPSEGTVDINPSPDPTWDYSHRFARRPLVTEKTNTSFVEDSVSALVGANPDCRNHIIRQYISAPLMYQSIGGVVKAFFSAIKRGDCATYTGQLVIKVVDPTGKFVRSHLYGGDREENSKKVVIADFWSVTPSSRAFPRSNLSPLGLTPGFAQDGDRLVVEVGFRSFRSSVTDQSGGIRFGDNSAYNLSLDNPGFMDDNPTISFSQDLVFA